MKQTSKCATVLALMVSVLMWLAPAKMQASPSVKERPLIQLAILLDTSNSMDGLIDQAKTQLWKVVNEMAKAKRAEASPQLEVALYEYGNDGLRKASGYIRQVMPLSADLDKLSEEMFKLRTNGGDEYCGAVIAKAASDLKWSGDSRTYKVIFIAGNEPFTQGQYNYKQACKEAIGKGIIVNTIFCGSFQEGVSGSWKDGADLADGKYMNIDQNQRVEYVAAPQDDEIAKLGGELNKTYVAYGAQGSASRTRQAEQDKNAMAASKGVQVERIVAKSAPQYSNTSWDMVDAVKEGKKVEEIQATELPEEMKKMSLDERKQYVAQMQQKRDEIQKKINTLKKARDQYVAGKQKEQGQKNTLDAVMVKAIQEQAAKKDLKFDK